MKNIYPLFLTVVVFQARLWTFRKLTQKKPCVNWRVLKALGAGTSSGGAVWASLKIAEQHPDAVIVCIVCDRGDRYLSTGLFSVQDEE